MSPTVCYEALDTIVSSIARLRVVVRGALLVNQASVIAKYRPLFPVILGSNIQLEMRAHRDWSATMASITFDRFAIL
jgi:hypothetical protein